MKVELVYKDIPAANILDLRNTNKGFDHWGVRITDNLDNMSGQWDFDWVGARSLKNWRKVLSEKPMDGWVGDASTKTFDRGSYTVATGFGATSRIYGRIQASLGPRTYTLNQYDCRHWALEMTDPN